MKWIKKGLIYRPKGDLWWAKTHAFLPTVDEITRNYIRIFFSSRDKDQVGRIGFVELDVKDPKKIFYLTKKPVLDIGEFGCFDESGVVPACIMTTNNEKRLYYFGWQKNVTYSYLLFCGLAISRDGGRSFERYSRVPILDRTNREPFIRSNVSVIEDNGVFRMWYSSGIDWTKFNDKPCPTYVIRYAESRDGINWNSTDRVCINFEIGDEFGFARPWVVKEKGVYRMWYSIRSKSKPYRIGYAESNDGLDWVRLDEKVGIGVSENGWDSEMVCFACVVSINNKKYMFYNGNRHGRDGFGYAELEAKLS